MSEPKKRIIQIKPYSIRELAELYGVGWRTIETWLKPFRQEIGEKRGRYFTIPQIKIIFEKLDYPSEKVIE
jgi:transposase